MSAILTTSTSSKILPANIQASRVWDAGGKHYDQISRQIADAIEHCIDRPSGNTLSGKLQSDGLG